MDKVNVGLYGTNGHQIQNALVNNPRAQLTAVAGFSPEALKPLLLNGSVKVYATLDVLLADPALQLVSLCSPLRSEQARDAIRALKTGKHVYGEKPSALTELELDEITATSRQMGRRYHEQAGTALGQPYGAIRKIVQSGVLGEIVQVISQKSYPWASWRPQDERIDGGLALQAGVYNTRFVEHVAGVKIKSIVMRQTKLGNEVAGGECRRAVSMLMELANGGLSSAIANYLCPPPPSWERWGYENVRIFGTEGFVESLDTGRVGTLALNGRPPQLVDCSDPGQDYLTLFLEEIQTNKDIIPFTLEDELSPTRWVVRGRATMQG